MKEAFLVRILEDTDGPASGRARVTVRYQTSDPLVVDLTFDPSTCSSVDDGPPPEWQIDRATLALGGGVPGGDVAVERSHEWVTVTLSPPEGRYRMRFPRAALDRFLADTFDVVPLGGEFAELDVDAAIADLLGEATR